MYRTELTYFIVLTVIILFSQFLPTGLLLLLDIVVVRILLVLALLYLIGLGPTAGILGFIAVAVIYLERNRRKVSVAVNKLNKMDWGKSEQATVEEASEPQKTVPVNEFDKPQEEEFDYMPHETCKSGNFEPVAPTINEKAVMSSIYPLNKSGPESGTAADKLFEQLGFGHIRGVETVGDSD